MNLKEQAQDAIIDACCVAAFKAEDTGHGDVAEAIRKEATKLAKRFGISDVPGLPATWPQNKTRYRGYRGL